MLLFAQAKGGAGKSTLLTQLAALWLGEGRRVAVLDLDPQRSASGWGRARTAAGRAGAPVTESADWRAAGDLREAARAADLVLVDTPGRADAAGIGLLGEAGLVVIPCQPSAPDVWATAATLAAVRGARRPHLVVLNRCPARSRAAAAAEARLAAEGAPVAAARLGARAAFAEAFMAGAGVTETDPGGKAAAELRALAAELLGRLP